MSGLYQLYRLRDQGFRVRVFEAATDVGGTWYWNRYPGARFDSESYSYGYSFSKELLEEWEWSEHFAGQPETLRYLNHVADKFDLRRDIQFRSRVTAAVYDENSRSWSIALEDGSEFGARFLITAIGPLSTPTLPRIEEREANYERLYGERGFGIWQGNFRDILIDRKANATISDFVARKIRQRVKNQAVAEKLIPRNHGFGTRRLPLETFYYEVYNQDNVELVDITETPIERITPTGIKTGDREYQFDIIIYATGFDAITGSFDRIDFQGVDGLRPHA